MQAEFLLNALEIVVHSAFGSATIIHSNCDERSKPVAAFMRKRAWGRGAKP
jgi:hypothetical protein